MQRSNVTAAVAKLALATVLVVGGATALAVLALAPHDRPPTPAAAPDPAASAEPRLAGDPVPPPDDPAAPGPMGYVPQPEKTAEFLRTLDEPYFRDAAKHLIRNRGPPPEDGAGAQEPVLLYRALYEARPDWLVGRQGIGDCVSWGWAHGADILLAVDLKLGRTAEWHAAATEAIYGGSRVEARGRTSGGWSDGSYGGAAAKWVSQWGIVFRQPYPVLGHDLTTYSSKLAKQWGNFGCGGQGDGGRLDAEAKRHAIRTVAVVATFDEAAAAIRNGYPIPVCSGQGFSSQRDAQGFARASGSWSHCMCFIGVRHDRPGLLCLNSWGPTWISGPKWPSDQPDGSFWVEASTATRMLRGRDSFAMSNYTGFPARKLRHTEGWGFVVPGESPLLAADHSESRRPALTHSPRAGRGPGLHREVTYATHIAGRDPRRGRGDRLRSGPGGPGADFARRPDDRPRRAGTAAPAGTDGRPRPRGGRSAADPATR